MLLDARCSGSAWGCHTWRLGHSRGAREAREVGRLPIRARLLISVVHCAGGDRIECLRSVATVPPVWSGCRKRRGKC